MNNDLNQLIPEIFDNPAWEDKIKLRNFQTFRGIKISTIEFNEHVHRTLLATNPANLHPFVNWKRTGAGHIQFTNISMNFTRSFNRNTGRTANPINPAAMATIHGFRDIRSAQANDRDTDSEGEY